MPALTPARLRWALLAAVLASCVVPASSSASHPSAGPPPRLCAQVDRQTMRCATRCIRRVKSFMEAGEDSAGPINTHLLERNAGSIRVAG
jgi:hypothetical protein